MIKTERKFSTTYTECTGAEAARIIRKSGQLYVKDGVLEVFVIVQKTDYLRRLSPWGEADGRIFRVTTYDNYKGRYCYLERM